MEAVRFVESIPRYVLSKALGVLHQPVFYSSLSCLQYRQVPEPELPGPEWVKVKTRYGGICGSDLNLVLLHDSPSLSPFTSFPFIVGHENVGVIVEKGQAVDDWAIGQRVIADPPLPCATRDFDPVCRHCARGEYQRCANYTRGSLPAGSQIGNCAATGGSWSPYYVAHRFQLFPVPDEVSDEDAILVDSFVSALHPVMRNFPKDDDTVLVIGAGVVGICVVAALRALGSKARLLVLAKHPFQAEWARHYGADQVILIREGDYFQAIAEATGATLLQPVLGKRIAVGGADVVFECVGSDTSVDDALRFTRSGGRLALVGLVGVTRKVDWTFLMFKELTVIGSLCSSTEDHEGRRVRCYQLALDWLAEGRIELAPLLTHTFPLGEWRRALAISLGKAQHHVVKSAFAFD